MKLFFTIMFVAAMATVGLGQITGTLHDFSGDAWNEPGEICQACHTPHNAQSVTGAVLWNHDVSAVSNYTLYTSNTLNATVGQPNGTSKLCLSCHDGTVALNDFGGNTFTGTDVFVTGVYSFGSDLSNDHPISFTYDATLATDDGGLYNPTTQTSGLGGTITEDLLSGESLECSSCHDVHNAPGTSTNLLRISNAASALCLTCHNK